MGKAKPTPTHPQASSPGRFARPITNTAESASAETTKAKGLQLIPPLKGDGVMMLADVIGQTGANEIIKTGALRFHSLGDSGGRGSRGSQEEIAEHMNGDFSSTGGDGGLNPAFCLHLGDVVYGPGKESEYLDQFYRAYTAYPGKFVAIPGNHALFETRLIENDSSGTTFDVTTLEGNRRRSMTRSQIARNILKIHGIDRTAVRLKNSEGRTGRHSDLQQRTVK